MRDGVDDAYRVSSSPEKGHVGCDRCRAPSVSWLRADRAEARRGHRTVGVTGAAGARLEAILRAKKRRRSPK